MALAGTLAPTVRPRNGEHGQHRLRPAVGDRSRSVCRHRRLLRPADGGTATASGRAAGAGAPDPRVRPRAGRRRLDLAADRRWNGARLLPRPGDAAPLRDGTGPGAPRPAALGPADGAAHRTG